MSLLKAFKQFNNIKLNNFFKFIVLDSHVGYINKSLAKQLKIWFSNNFIITNETLILISLGNSVINFNNLTNFFNEIAILFFDKKLIPKITKEYFIVNSLDTNKELFKIERTLIPLFGIQAKGVHLNGYVIKNNLFYIWVGKRSKDKLLYPGKLDNLAAGAISYGYNAFNTLIKESFEEASINKDIVEKATLSRTLSYMYPYNKGIRNDIMYIYNLELPLNFIPQKNDGEMEEFFLLESKEVITILNNTIDSFKFNSAIAIINFLIDKELINESNTDYKVLTVINKYLTNMTKKI